jgi:hypothetical protein
VLDIADAVEEGMVVTAVEGEGRGDSGFLMDRNGRDGVEGCTPSPAAASLRLGSHLALALPLPVFEMPS